MLGVPVQQFHQRAVPEWRAQRVLLQLCEGPENADFVEWLTPPTAEIPWRPGYLSGPIGISTFFWEPRLASTVIAFRNTHIIQTYGSDLER